MTPNESWRAFSLGRPAYDKQANRFPTIFPVFVGFAGFAKYLCCLREASSSGGPSSYRSFPSRPTSLVASTCSGAMLLIQFAVYRLRQFLFDFPAFGEKATFKCRKNVVEARPVRSNFDSTVLIDTRYQPP